MSALLEAEYELREARGFFIAEEIRQYCRGGLTVGTFMPEFNFYGDPEFDGILGNIFQIGFLEARNQRLEVFADNLEKITSRHNRQLKQVVLGKENPGLVHDDPGIAEILTANSDLVADAADKGWHNAVNCIVAKLCGIHPVLVDMVLNSPPTTPSPKMRRSTSSFRRRIILDNGALLDLFGTKVPNVRIKRIIHPGKGRGRFAKIAVMAVPLTIPRPIRNN